MVNEEKVDWGENRSGEKSWKRPESIPSSVRCDRHRSCETTSAFVDKWWYGLSLLFISSLCLYHTMVAFRNNLRESR
jgi:hypothetical protein